VHRYDFFFATLSYYFEEFLIAPSFVLNNNDKFPSWVGKINNKKSKVVFTLYSAMNYLLSLFNF